MIFNTNMKHIEFNVPSNRAIFRNPFRNRCVIMKNGTLLANFVVEICDLLYNAWDQASFRLEHRVALTRIFTMFGGSNGG